MPVTSCGDKSAWISDSAVEDFLQRFDEISAREYVLTQRSCDTGVGYTLDALLWLAENNDRRGDFLGIEVKAWRTSPNRSSHRRPMNLFLKGPEWLDRGRAAE